VASANRPASASTPSLAPSVHCDTKQTIDGGDSIIDANPPPPSLVSYENALQLLAAHHAKKRHMESKKKKNTKLIKQTCTLKEGTYRTHLPSLSVN
jgi:hypothetical protein